LRGRLNIGTVEHGSPYIMLCAYGFNKDVVIAYAIGGTGLLLHPLMTTR